MLVILYFIAKLIAILLEAVSLAMLIQALMPLFTSVDENRFYIFLCALTEPFIYPVRYVLNKFGLLDKSPIDWSFLLTYILLSIVTVLLPVI